MTVLDESLLLGAPAAASSYQISRSLRFNAGDSPKLSRTPGSQTNRRTWTFSTWLKRCDDQSGGILYINGTGTDYFILNTFSGGFAVTDFTLYYVSTGSAGIRFRDTSAWYHIVLTANTTSATATERLKLYVNGVLISAAAAYPTVVPQDFDFGVNRAAVHEIGSNSFNGYLADVHFIDGQALTPSSFGEFDTNGIWQPKAYTGTYGTNGFKLDFADNSNNTAATLGKDTSGNGNNWTPTNLSVTAGSGNDSLVDSPTNYGTDTGVGGEVRGNYATWSPTFQGATGLSNGCLDGSLSAGQSAFSSISVTSGKWYWEVTITSAPNDVYLGIMDSTFANASSSSWSSQSRAYRSSNGNKYDGTSTAYGTIYTTNDVIGVALDLDGGTLTFYKNGVSQGVAFSTLLTGKEWKAFVYNGVAFSANFGQRPFAYTAPSGFKALCSTNLPTPTILNGATAMDVKLYTGNGSTQTISGLGFGPDLVWLKARNQAATSNRLFDIVRGAGNVLYSDATSAESAEGSLTSFDAAGFTLPNSGTTNLNTTTYAAWCWDAGSSNVVNTQGSITSTVRANPSAGFSVCTVTATSTNDVTFGHGLGVAPQLIIGKNRTATNNWIVYHKSLTADNALYLNTTGASVLDYAYSQGVGATPSSTIVPIRRGNWGVSGDNLVFYCFAPVAGYSSFGSYTGNGNASNDGPFVYTGFRPRWVMIKSTSSGNWTIFDALRVGYNVDNEVVYPNLASGSGVDNDRRIDILSNGFKIRNTAFGSTDINGTTATTYIYAAFAENPFSISRAR